MQLRFLIFLIFGWVFSLNASGQEYYELVLEPFFMENVYGGKDYTYTCQGECYLNDTLKRKEIVIKCLRNESISISKTSVNGYSTIVIRYEVNLIYDDQKRIKEYKFRSTLRSNIKYDYKYLSKNTVEIEYTSNYAEPSGYKRSVSTLKYNDRGMLEEFYKVMFFENDSVSTATYDVKTHKNDFIIQAESYKQQYFFDNQRQLIAVNTNGKRSLEIKYDKNGRIMEILTYYVSIDATIFSVKKYSYNFHGNLVGEEYTRYLGGGVFDFWLNCSYCKDLRPK